MSTTYTSHAKFARPAPGDRNWDAPLLADLDALDGIAAIGGLCVTPAEVPSTSLVVVVAPGDFLMLSGIPAHFGGDISTLPDGDTRYLWLTDGGGLVQGSAFPGTPYVPLARITTAGGVVTSVEDLRVCCATQGAPALVPVMTKTAAYTLTDADGVILADAAGGAFTVTLPSAVGRPGRQFTVKRTNSGANNVTVGTTSSQTIDGAATYVLTAQYMGVTMISNNAHWSILGKVS